MLEISFEHTYPNTPPFVRIVRPRFIYRTGHVTVGGSFCIESLTSKGWESARTMQGVLMEVLCLIQTGGGRLQIKNSRDYTLKEAKSAFIRTLKVHKWN